MPMGHKTQVGRILERKGSAGHRTSMEQRKMTLYEGKYRFIR